MKVRWLLPVLLQSYEGGMAVGGGQATARVPPGLVLSLIARARPHALAARHIAVRWCRMLNTPAGTIECCRLLVQGAGPKWPNQLAQRPKAVELWRRHAQKQALTKDSPDLIDALYYIFGWSALASWNEASAARQHGVVVLVVRKNAGEPKGGCPSEFSDSM